MASSSSQARISSKQLGDGVAGDVVQVFDELENVPDSEATWHDARTVSALFPESQDRLLFGGICVVEADVPVEIKATLVVRSAGNSQRKGQWYIKCKAHDRLLAEDGVYIFVVYQQRRGRTHLARLVVPAATVDDVLETAWYEVSADRSEDEVAQLSWNRLIDESRLTGRKR